MTPNNLCLAAIVPMSRRADTMAQQMTNSPFELADDQPAIPASTLLLLRDGDAGLEVLMLKRHLDSDFVGGAFVFPGGKVDATDLKMPADAVSRADPTGYEVAAVRESFEECGVLLARRSGKKIDGAMLASRKFREARHRLASRDERWDWRSWLVSEEIVLDLDALAWWSWWVTPAGVHRRFETKFFVALAPPGHEASHDNVETVDSRWVRPQDALLAAASGAVTIILPTRKNLAQLTSYPTAETAVGAARDGSFERPRIQPSIVTDDHGVVKVDHSSFPEPELP